MLLNFFGTYNKLNWRILKNSKSYMWWTQQHIIGLSVADEFWWDHVVELYGFNFRQVLSLGMHIGHGLKNCVFHTSWMIMAHKARVAIIHPYYTALAFRNTVAVFSVEVSCRRPVWFVSANSMYLNLVKNIAIKVGESFIVRYGWLYGFFANFTVIFSFLLLLRYYLKKGYFLPRRYRIFLSTLEGLQLSRSRPPSLMFVASVTHSYEMLTDAYYCGAIGNVGVADTDVSVEDMTGLTPANDECFMCMQFYLEMIARHVLLDKYLYLECFLKHIKNIKRQNTLTNKLVYLSLFFPTEYDLWEDNIKYLWHIADRASVQGKRKYDFSKAGRGRIYLYNQASFGVSLYV